MLPGVFLFVGCCRALRAVCCALVAARCSLIAARWSLAVAGCSYVHALLLEFCCLMFVVYRVQCVACCFVVCVLSARVCVVVGCRCLVVRCLLLIVVPCVLRAVYFFLV